MKANFFTILFFLSLTWVKAQNDVLFSQYFLQPSFFNPAWNGFQQTGYFSAIVRSQWTGYSSSFDGNGGAPNTQMVAFALPVRGALITNVGINAINDNLGPVNNIQVNFPVTISKPMKKGVASLAAMPGVVSQTVKFDEFRFVDPSDPFNIGTRESQSRMNFSAGFMYQFFNGSMIGASATNIFQPTFDYGLDSLTAQYNRTYHLTGTYAKTLGRDYKLMSGFLFKSDLVTYTFDVNTILSFKNRAWAGLSYRRDEAIIFMIGYAFMSDQRLKLGYSMDYVINERAAKQLTSQEIYLLYNLPDLMLGGRKQVKTPRFTY